ncbi:Bifunctional DNA primase/polymerase, N-terminal [Mycobacteroides abscessus subsp. abscessus]|uniref:AAA family ATPase n=1 Tax=Mycobacteroides abscessus TaxID=36809 RepID=UPI00092A8FEA|nr:AAA family ATPase [Mycobacteroides abscessus]SHX66543.1 Bifunctional DNA primase/polymerase, N-terminal [Mycobacteroides abscessus subsp. abscessus]SIC60052.1 Bifunctional DNA primase/polymerase, N-terminal [Mycobacteroides abscessus subsp. abscessus]SKK20827.1 Bifunctional DNA primase/polymerase, N-terminal [Mycobacteroides abscessus subsp. abscessus]SKP50334.1 Bifunctional DNA primase/polymerase, N-terminal [Mycobacteroides abscessus subsp. abscessus]
MTASASYTPRDLIERMTALGAHLTKLKPGIKKPSGTGWTVAAALTVDQADQHVADGGNLGVNLGNSKMIAFDCEDLLASQAVAGAGFAPTVIPAKAQYEGILKPGLEDPDSGKQNRKVDGSHVWLLLPDGIDPTALTSERSMQLRLPNGGTMDVLAGPRYVVAPLSRLEIAYGAAYLPAGVGPLDLTTGQEPPGLAVAPMWLFDLSVPCPPELAPLHGCLIPRVRERVEQNARSIELSNQIDEVSWPEWIAGDHRISYTGEIDGCGCEIVHYQGASHGKSATLHDGCVNGNGAHIWSGTMLAELGLPGEHVSRLDLAVGLQGESRHVVAAGHGITLGEEREELQSVTPDVYDRLAARFADDPDRAALFSEAAAVMRRVAPTPEQRGETYLDGPVTGWVPATPIQRPAQPTSEPADAPMATVYPFPVVHPTFTSTPAPAGGAAPTGAAPSIGNLGGPASAGPAPTIGNLGGATPPTAGANALKLAAQEGTEVSALVGLKNGAWLDKQVFAPLEYHVPGIVAEGCGIVAGPPKAGKSWLVLAIALAIAAGGIALGCLTCKQRPVLYLALEDGDRRIQFRARQLLGEGVPIPAAFEYVLAIEEGKTAVSTITEWLALHPGQKPFVIVDTLGKTRGAGPKSGASAYQEDYKALGDLKKCVDAIPGSGMLIVHHTRKAEPGRGGGRAADFVEELSGTFGLSGAADYAMVLHRDRETDGGVLAVTGRDVIERTMAMTRDPETGLWTLDGGSIDAAVAVIEESRIKPDEESIGDTSQQIVAAVLAGCPNPDDTMDAQQIADAVNSTPTRIYKYLQRLSSGARPFLSKPSRGRYAPPLKYPGAAPVVPEGVAPAVGAMPPSYVAPPIGGIGE